MRTSASVPRALAPVYAVVFLDVLGLTIVIPLLPVLAQRTHAPIPAIGLALSVTALCAALSSTFWGALSDRIGRKSVLLLSQTFSFAGYLTLAFAATLPALVLSRAIEGFGGGNIGVAQSLIADLTRPAQRERAFAFAGAAFGIGFVVGPVLAGQLLRLGTAVPFLAAAAAQLANFALTSWLLPVTGALRAEAGAKTAIREALRLPALRFVLARQSLYILAFTYFFSVFSLYLSRSLSVPPETSSLLLGLAGAIGAAAQLLGAPALERRFGDAALARGSFAAAFVAYAALALVHASLAVFLGVLVLWAASGALLQPALAKQTAAAAPASSRGAVLGLSDSLNNAAMIVSPTAAAFILARAPDAIGVAPAICVAIAFGLTFASPARATSSPAP